MVKIEEISRAVKANFVLAEDPTGKNKLYCDPEYEGDSEAGVIAAIGIAVERGFSTEEIKEEYRIYEDDEVSYKKAKFFKKMKSQERFRTKIQLVYNYLIHWDLVEKF